GLLLAITGQTRWARIGKINGIFAPMSVGAHPWSSPHLDAASHLGTAFSLLIPVEIFCLYTAHMCSIAKHISCHIYTLDPGRRRHAWHLLWRPTHPAIRATRCSLP